MARNLLQSWGMLARCTILLRIPATVLPVAVLPAIIIPASLTGGCLFPPELDVAVFDAGPGSPPVILSAGPAPDFTFPGPLVIERQDTRTLSLTVLDNEIDDVLHVRLFIDYDKPNPQPAYAECQAAPTGETTRVLACDLTSICNPIADTDQGDHVLEAMVADREFLADSDPAAEGQKPFRALRDPDRAAFSFRSWVMRCNPPAEL